MISLATEFQNRRPEKEEITTERFVATKRTKKQNKINNTEQANKPKTTEKHSIGSDHSQQPYKQQLHFFSTLRFI